MIERLQKLIALGSSIAALLAAIGLLAFGQGQSDQVSHPAFYFARQVAYDLAFGAVVGALLWLALRWRPVLPAVLMPITVILILLPGYYVLRARVYFWRELPRRAYASAYVNTVDRLISRGRLNDAFELSTTVFVNLEGRAEQSLYRSRVYALGARLKRSEELSRNASSTTASSWNPVAEPDRFFRLAEAVRLNPQNFAAAEALEQMARHLAERALPADVKMICDAGVRGPYRTLSKFEGDLRVSLRRSVNDCRRSVMGRWNLDIVACAIARSRATRRGLPLGRQGVGGPEQCRGVEFEGAFVSDSGRRHAIDELEPPE